MRYIDVAYTQELRTLTVSDSLAGTTVDDLSTSFRIDETTAGLGATIEMVYGVILRTPDGLVTYPFSRFEDGVAAIPQAVLKACRGGSLPVYLRLTYLSDGSVESSLPLTLKVANLPDPIEAAHASGNVVMLRMDSWEWRAGWAYAKEAIVVHNGAIWLSQAADNIGNEPADKSEFWAKVGESGPGVDLSDYYTKEQTADVLKDYVTKQKHAEDLVNEHNEFMGIIADIQNMIEGGGTVEEEDSIKGRLTAIENLLNGEY